MAGIPVDDNGINYAIGQLVTDLMGQLDYARTLKVALIDDGRLAASGLSQDAKDKTSAAILALDKLAAIGFGQDVQAAPSNFFHEARKLRGLNR